MKRAIDGLLARLEQAPFGSDLRLAPCRTWRRKLPSVTGFALWLLTAGAAVAEPPQVRFDAAAVLACTEVCDPDFVAHNPDERLVEARVAISSLLERGTEADIAEYFYRIECAQRVMQVADYLPKSTLATDYAEGLALEKKHEISSNVGVSASSGPWDCLLKATPSASIGTKDTSTLSYRLLPPKQQVTASGTLARGAGVYFKLKPSSQTAFEGGKEFVLLLRAPRDWRAGYLHVQCLATGYHRGVVSQFDERAPCGAAAFTVALHAAGDEAAKRAAMEFVYAEAAFRRQAFAHRGTPATHVLPKLEATVDALFGVADPPSRIPDAWVQRVLVTSAPDTPKFSGQLPAAVRAALADYSLAKQQMLTLSGEMETR